MTTAEAKVALRKTERTIGKGSIVARLQEGKA